MKIYIFADMEGISGVCGSQFVLTDGNRYGMGQKYMTQDVNTCAAACFAAGATQVIVRDGHGGGNNIIWDEMLSGVQLIQGATPRKRFYGLEGCDGMILLGYHAMAGTPQAHLEHTFSSSTIQNMWFNGKKIGEFGIDTIIAGEYDVPVIMTSGCDKLCCEAKEFLPSVVTCQVKTSTSQQGAMLLAMRDAQALIREKTTEAISLLQAGKMPTVKVSSVALCTEYTERNEPQFGLSEARIKKITAPTLEEALYM